MMTVAARIEMRLREALDPAALDIVNDSGRHTGHAGDDGSGETHFNVTVVTAAFEGMTRVARQRRVHAVLAEELATRIHALSLTLLTPGEALRTPRMTP